MADLRIGILTQKERWHLLMNVPVFVDTETYLQPLYESIEHGESILIDAAVMPTKELVQEISELNVGEGLKDENGLVAFCTSTSNATEIKMLQHYNGSTLQDISTVKRLSSPQQIFLWNDEMIRFDFELLTQHKTSQPLQESVQYVNAANIFLEEGTSVSHCTINASAGPVYIGKNATIMEGCLIRGPFALCEGAVLKMGAKVYGATTIGPFSNACGEIKNSIICGYSNKAHDGYLGDSVIGEWCNLGAGTTNSNVKNTGGEIGLHNYSSGKYEAAGNKCGVIMGDYSRTAINTSLNTGTVVGLCCNVFGNGLTPKFIPDFSWGFDELKTYDFAKAIQDINNWKSMKNSFLSENEITVLKYLFEQCFPSKKI